VVGYDALISAMPVDRLCNEVIVGLPDEVRAAAAGLQHTGGYVVGVGLRQPCPSTRSWMYFGEADCPFYRVTYLGNHSPRMAPEGCYNMICETSYSALKPVDGSRIVDDTIRGLVAAGVIAERDQDDIVDTWVHHAEYSYPLPSVDRDVLLERVIPHLEGLGIYSRGRFGLWKYEVSNTDHCVMQGVELVDRLLGGEPETTLRTRYRSTPDGRDTGR
jgi:hypothetical protein